MTQFTVTCCYNVIFGILYSGAYTGFSRGHIHLNLVRGCYRLAQVITRAPLGGASTRDMKYCVGDALLWNIQLCKRK